MIKNNVVAGCIKVNERRVHKENHWLLKGKFDKENLGCLYFL